ncbi:MAG: DUF2207 domain-containing protein [Erysipelotrichales bacterium]|nr:DUF2207 domain-containing protein [Erysipelotrichales bacterium]
MKKYLLLIFTLFLFSPKVYALSMISNMNVNIDIEENGVANFSEEWQISTQNNNYFEKEFYETNDAVITDLVVTDSNNSVYTYLEKFDSSRSLVYNFQNKKNKQKIRIMTNGGTTNLNVSYKVSGIITKFDDVEGINWYLLSTTSSQEITLLNIYISGPIDFSSTNTALYGLGNNVTTGFEDGKIHITSSNVKPNSKIKLMASINDYEFENHQIISGTLEDNYESISKASPILGYVRNILDNIVIVILILMVIILLIIFIIYKLLKRNKMGDDYKKIITYNNEKFVGELSTVPYVDFLPCNNDLYKIYFIANYFNIIKHRSSLVGALIFKWIISGFIDLKIENDKYHLILKENVKFERNLDQELYDILLKSSTNNIIDNNKLIRYAKEEDEEFIGWYDNVITSVIKDEYDNGHIQIKGSKIILNKEVFNEGVNIQGLKKYLLNFNQVPRKTELTEDVYKNLLTVSILLRVDENLYQEILRKSPDNINAKLLENFSKVKPIYNNIYSTVFEEFTHKKHKRNLKIYNPEKNK